MVTSLRAQVRSQLRSINKLGTTTHTILPGQTCEHCYPVRTGGGYVVMGYGEQCKVCGHFPKGIKACPGYNKGRCHDKTCKKGEHLCWAQLPSGEPCMKRHPVVDHSKSD